MVYLHNTTQMQVMHFPLDGKEVPASPLLILRSTIDLTDFECAVKVAERHLSFVRVRFRLPQVLTPGSYEYRLQDGADTLISAGVAMLGEVEEDFKESESEIEFKQYE